MILYVNGRKVDMDYDIDNTEEICYLQKQIAIQLQNGCRGGQIFTRGENDRDGDSVWWDIVIN